jgi:hypothetical protein
MDKTQNMSILQNTGLGSLIPSNAIKPDTIPNSTRYESPKKRIKVIKSCHTKRESYDDEFNRDSDIRILAATRRRKKHVVLATKVMNKINSNHPMPGSVEEDLTDGPDNFLSPTRQE